MGLCSDPTCGPCRQVRAHPKRYGLTPEQVGPPPTDSRPDWRRPKIKRKGKR